MRADVLSRLCSTQHDSTKHLDSISNSSCCHTEPTSYGGARGQGGMEAHYAGREYPHEIILWSCLCVKTSNCRVSCQDLLPRITWEWCVPSSDPDFFLLHLPLTHITNDGGRQADTGGGLRHDYLRHLAVGSRGLHRAPADGGDAARHRGRNRRPGVQRPLRHPRFPSLPSPPLPSPPLRSAPLSSPPLPVDGGTG